MFGDETTCPSRDNSLTSNHQSRVANHVSLICPDRIRSARQLTETRLISDNLILDTIYIHKSKESDFILFRVDITRARETRFFHVPFHVRYVERKNAPINQQYPQNVSPFSRRYSLVLYSFPFIANAIIAILRSITKPVIIKSISLYRHFYLVLQKL